MASSVCWYFRTSRAATLTKLSALLGALLFALSFASPVTAADDTRPWLGVSYQSLTAELAEAVGDGAQGDLVIMVNVGSPAQKAGLRPGDLITGIDGQEVTLARPFASHIAQLLPGLSVPITVVREGQTLSLRITLGQRPAEYLDDRSYFEGTGQAPDDSGRHIVAGATLTTLTPAIAEPLGLGKASRGAVVLSVEPGSSAEEIGLQRGDAIFAVNGKRTTSALAAAEAYVIRPDSAERPALLMIGRKEAASFMALPPKPLGLRAKWGIFYEFAGQQYANVAGSSVARYYWGKVGGQLYLFESAPGAGLGTNRRYDLKPDGTLTFTAMSYQPNGTHVPTGDLWTVRILNDLEYEMVKGKDVRRYTYKRSGNHFEWSVSEVKRDGSLKKPLSTGTQIPVDAAEVERLAAAYKQNQANLAAQQQAQAQARNSSGGGGGGLFGALGGAALGALAGGNSEQIMGAAMKGAAIVDPNMAALGSVGDQMISGNTGSVGALGSGSGGGSYPTRPNALGGSPACSMMNQGNYRDVSLSGGNDVQLKTMCGQAFEYYNMYLNAISQGYSEADANRTYAAHQGAAQNAISFYQNNR